jgi:hypothetical protein
MKLSVFAFITSLFLATANANAAPATCDFHFTTQNVCASFQWVSEPAHSAVGAFHLTFWDATQDSENPVLVTPDTATVNVRLFMTSMGHGGGLVKVAQTLNEQGQPEVGQFDATQVRFVMSGPWEIIVELKDETGTVKDSAQISYRAH